jgi:surface polysaccharide O-acyltransferase-like enzyme
MRPVKQVGVVSTHTLLVFAPLLTLAAGGSLMLLHVTREAFLFVSSCMLTYSYQGLTRDRYTTYYRKRGVSVLLPYVCWTVIYFLLTLPSLGATPLGALGHLGYLLGTGYYQLYYLLVIMQFYLLFPLVLVLFRRVRHHVALLIVSGVVQVAFVSMIHWGLMPPWLHGFWATREIFSYQFYLVAGMVVALHLDQFHDWLRRHVALVLILTLAAALVAEIWFVAAAKHWAGWLGDPSDPFQPIVIPFNVGAIAAIYLVGVWLVGERRTPRVRAVVRSGSDDAYGIYLAQMVFILALSWCGWSALRHVMPWELVSGLTVVLVVSGCVLLTSLLARTPLAVALTGRRQAGWDTWWPRAWRSPVSRAFAEADDRRGSGDPSPLALQDPDPASPGPAPGPMKGAAGELIVLGGRPKAAATASAMTQ